MVSSSLTREVEANCREGLREVTVDGLETVLELVLVAGTDRDICGATRGGEVLVAGC